MGKGGVGKTTTAGALALAFADSGERTLLISTDPAHSLGDLFGVALPPGSPLPSPCHERLLLEALDADGFGRRWMERARRPLVELFDRGTYLDREDVEGFLDLTLPGVDEVAGVLRLAEIADEDHDRVVVDTAPTGHTLRLLDAGAVVRAWTEAFDAIAEKAAAVIGRLTRQPVRLEADELTGELRDHLERFRGRVVAEGSAVVVGRSGTVVEAETRRLEAAVEERGLHVALRLHVAEPVEAAAADDEDPVRVPFNDGLSGCEGLRRWGAPGEAAAAVATSARTGGTEAFLQGLPSLLFFAGKGGVGKSTCAAAAALALSERHEVTLLGTDPAGSLADVLAVRLEDGRARIGDRLDVRQVMATEEFDALTARYRESVEAAFRGLGLGGSAALDRRVVGSLLGLAPPGMDEAFAVSALLDDVGGLGGGSPERRVVVDTAPTGHFLRLMGMPGVALDWTHQLLRVIRKYRAVLGLDAFAERLLEFAKRLKELDSILSDPDRSAAIVVTQPGPLVAAESDRLTRGLRASGMRVAAVLANRTSEGAPPPDVPSGAVALRAPTLPDPPVGPEALRDFARSWAIFGAAG